MKNLHRTSTYLNPGISFFHIVTLNNLDSSRCMGQEGKHLERSQKSVTVTLMLLSPSHRDLQGAHLPLFCPRAQQGHSCLHGNHRETPETSLIPSSAHKTQYSTFRQIRKLFSQCHLLPSLYQMILSYELQHKYYFQGEK